MEYQHLTEEELALEVALLDNYRPFQLLKAVLLDKINNYTGGQQGLDGFIDAARYSFFRDGVLSVFDEVNYAVQFSKETEIDV